jgi:amino-acid N-acetyltransferase
MPRSSQQTFVMDTFGEKSFYLEEFRRQTLLVAVPATAVRRSRDVAPLMEAVRDLVGNATRLVLVWGDRHRRRSAKTGSDVLARLTRMDGLTARRAKRWLAVPADGAAPITVSLLRRIWTMLRGDTLAVARVVAEAGELADFAQRLGVRLGVRKLVLVDPDGGIANETGLVSFMDGDMLEELLRRGEAEWAGVGHRRPVLEAVRGALHGGVDSVNVVDLQGVARELFTYEGAGTLFTLEDYCRVERLRIDEFLEVERLLERGQREGYLRCRNAEEISGILLNGYGATIGSGHLAGVCALATEPYRAARAGEIVGLYTITRFKGEGVGGKLLARAIEDARHLGLRYVFACTMHDRARAFFARHGFERVASTEVPAAKWRGYEPRRRRELTTYKLWITPERAGGADARRHRGSSGS